mgnify:FL=1
MTDRDNSADTTQPPERDGADRDPLGPLVKSLRLVRGLSQEALALRVGIAPDTIRRVEHGRMNPTIATLRKIATGLDLRLSTLVSLLERETSDVQLLALVDLLHTIDNRTLTIVDTMVRTLIQQMEKQQ